MRAARLWALFGFVAPIVSSSFVSQPSAKHDRIRKESTACPLQLSRRNDDDEKNREEAERNLRMRTDFRNFLTQRCLQSFMALLISCRDPHTIKWLEDFGGWKNLEEFHGTGAISLERFPSWNRVFLEIMEQPPDVVVVSARRRGRGHGGWSKNNPYLEDRFVEFNIDIDPTSLTQRMISVREQLAQEWAEDLDTLQAANDMILSSYNTKMQEECELEETDTSCDERGVVRKRIAFDRNAQFMLKNANVFNDMASSPLRQGNFDLLLLLSTQEAVHRVLREYRDGGREREVSFEWFREFYEERVADFFDGNQEHGRADDFLEEILLTPPTVKTEGRMMSVTDPLRVAQDVIKKRGEVAMEWKSIAEHIQDDHVDLRKALLTKQMAKWGSSTSNIVMEDSADDFQ